MGRERLLLPDRAAPVRLSERRFGGAKTNKPQKAQGSAFGGREYGRKDLTTETAKSRGNFAFGEWGIEAGALRWQPGT
jgi:hypothetical protein